MITFTAAVGTFPSPDATQALVSVLTAARALELATAAVEATEGEDPAILSLMDDRVQALAEAAWILEGDTVDRHLNTAAHAMAEAPAFGRSLWALPVLMLALQRQPLTAPVFMGDSARPGTDLAGLHTDPAWRYCRMMALDIVAGLQATVEGVKAHGGEILEVDDA